MLTLWLLHGHHNTFNFIIRHTHTNETQKMPTLFSVRISDTLPNILNSILWAIINNHKAHKRPPKYIFTAIIKKPAYVYNLRWIVPGFTHSVLKGPVVCFEVLLAEVRHCDIEIPLNSVTNFIYHTVQKYEKFFIIFVASVVVPSIYLTHT